MLKRIAACILLLSLLQVPAVLGAGTEDVTNGGFDSTEGWNLPQTGATVEKESDTASNTVLKLTGAVKADVTQSVEGILPGKTYTFSGRYKAPDGGLSLKFEWKVSCGWKRTSASICGEAWSPGGALPKTTGTEWGTFSGTSTAPAYADCVTILLRKTTASDVTILLDDIRLEGEFGETPIEENPFKKDAAGTAELSLDEVFYYTDKTTATATVKTGLSADKVTYTLYEGKTKIWEKTENYGKPFSFALSSPQSSLKEETQYKLFAQVKDGTRVIAEGEQIFYRVKRPTALDADGKYYPVTVDQNTGEVKKEDKELNPVIMYSIFSDYAKKYEKSVNDGGITVVQGYPSVLDTAKDAGVKVLVVLYSAKPKEGDGCMLPAGHPDNVAYTRSVISRYKNHEAVFGWIVVDEPQLNMVTNGPYDVDDVNSFLLNSYRVIHEEDPHHPVFVMQDAVANYGTAAKAVDILGIDPYINKDQEYHSGVYVDAVKAVEACKNEKPVYALVQASDFEKGFPTPAQLRHMVYQARLAGVKGFGYYRYDAAHNNQNLSDTVLWDEIKKIKTEKELIFSLGKGEIRDHGVYGETEDGKGVILYMGSEEASVLTATYADSTYSELIDVEFTPISETEKMAVYEDTANKKRFIWTDGQGFLAPGV